MSLRLGSLFSGAGGLDLAIEEVFGSELRWVSDIIARDKHGRQIGDAPRILAHRFPGVPNLGDITAVDWAGVEPVDIVAGGSPCQDVSDAGQRRGMTEGTRSNLWVAMREAIAQLEPAYVIWENVRGSLTARADSALESDPRLLGDHRPGVPALRAAGRVLGDLADLGFDAAWCVLPASGVGAPHRRERIFAVAVTRDPARRAEVAGRLRGWPHRSDWDEWAGLRPSEPGRVGWGRHADTRGETCLTGALDPGVAVQLLPTPKATNNTNRQSADRYGPNLGQALGITPITAGRNAEPLEQWGKYAAAIARWEQLTRPAPAPTIPGKNGRPRLNPQFSEWMMGWPAGWVTDVPGMRDAWKHHAIGNGVVPQQASAAIRWCLYQLARVEALGGAA